MAPSATPFKPSYTALKNLHHKVHKHSATSVNLTLPIRPQDLATDVHPYLDDAIGLLSHSTAFLYDDNAPWAVNVTEVKKGVEKVDVKVAEVKAEVAEVKTQMKSLEERLTTQVDDVKTQVDDVRASLHNHTVSLRNHTAIQLNSL